MLACVCASLRRSVRLVVRARAESCVVVDEGSYREVALLEGERPIFCQTACAPWIESVGALSSRHWTRAESSRMTRSSLTTLERFACRIAATWGSPARATRAHDHSAPCMWLKRPNLVRLVVAVFLALLVFP